VGAAVVFFGAVLMAFDPLRWDIVILSLPRHHGIHLTDFVGVVLVMLGVAVLWRAPREG
jgi:hypothetical protein